MDNMDYEYKYIKYKSKYENIKTNNIYGGANVKVFYILQPLNINDINEIFKDHNDNFVEYNDFDYKLENEKNLYMVIFKMITTDSEIKKYVLDNYFDSDSDSLDRYIEEIKGKYMNITITIFNNKKIEHVGRVYTYYEKDSMTEILIFLDTEEAIDNKIYNILNYIIYKKYGFLHYKFPDYNDFLNAIKYEITNDKIEIKKQQKQQLEELKKQQPQQLEKERDIFQTTHNMRLEQKIKNILFEIFIKQEHTCLNIENIDNIDDIKKIYDEIQQLLQKLGDKFIINENNKKILKLLHLTF